MLVSNDVLNKGINIGDTLPATLTLYGDQREVSFVILAAIDLWPGYYPQDGPIIIANLDYIFDQMGGQYPYDVLIARSPDVDINQIATDVRRLGVTLIDLRDAPTLIAAEQVRPQRQGLFGLLSVGFLTAGALTLLGFFLSTLITARRRLIQLGVLQALGLSRQQATAAVIIEQVILIGGGLGAGTGIGLFAALLVVPQFQVAVGPHPGTPSFPPQIAWQEVGLIYGVFAVTLGLVLLVLVWLLSRMRLFLAVKLGDAH